MVFITDAEEYDVIDNFKKLRDCVENSANKSVIVVGDVMLDRYIFGFANNLNHTAPVPVLKETGRQSGAGAAAHVARSLHDLGLKPLLFSAIGNDSNGVELEESLENIGIDTSNLIMIEGRKTTVKTRLIGSRESLVHNKQMLLRWDSEDSEPLQEELQKPILDAVLKAIPDSNIVVISDYGKGVINPNAAKEIISSAKSANVPVIFDPKLTGLPYSNGSDAVLFQSRGMELMRRRLNYETTDETAQHLLEEHKWGGLFVIKGKDGVTLHRLDMDSVTIPCNLSQTLQQIGLLDAAAAALCVSLAHGLDVDDGAVLVNAACECVLQGEDMDGYVLTKKGLATRLDETAWQMQISQR
ncbi:MAG: PfkB family carbohydrate kinase [Candidatus Thermoplasmatota archaeon]|nr:PfkB family carbohydrate kinase [Candidatus Thermoplasmatota archaeon]MEE3134768.1 PfkB family carbohydrate kinase [Candidatus Thermoplasmatota archaeon]